MVRAGRSYPPGFAQHPLQMTSDPSAGALPELREDSLRKGWIIPNANSGQVERTRTSGLMVPNHAPYLLSYTLR